MRRFPMKMQIGEVQKQIPVFRQNVVLTGVRLEPELAHVGHVERRRAAFKHGGGENRAASIRHAIRRQTGYASSSPNKR